MGIANWFKKPEQKTSRTRALLVDGGGEVRWSDKNYENYAKEAYLKCIVAYRCILEIAQSVASVDWLLMEKGRGKDKEIEEHPILDLLDYPNPAESGTFLRLKLQAFIDLAGNSYLERVMLKTTKNPLPKELYVLRPDRMKILSNDKGVVKGYEYQVNMNKVQFPVNTLTGQADILHMKTFHPVNDWYGSAPTESMAREIDTHNEATTWNMRLLQNQARPGMLFFFKESLTDEQYEKFDQKLKERFTGGMQAGKSLIVEGEGSDARPYGWSPAEMDFIEGNREKARAIALGYGVPPMLLGIPGDNTYSNYKEARLSFCETTVLHRISLMGWGLNNWLLDRKSGLYLTPDLDSISALEPRRAETWQKAKEADWLTVNEKRTLTGYDEIEGGDTVLVSSTVIPLEQAILPPEEPVLIDEGDEGE